MTASPLILVSIAIARGGVLAMRASSRVCRDRPPFPLRAHVWVEPTTGMTFVELPPATFEMGSPAEERDREGGEVLHRVTLSRATWMAVHEVTQGQWREVMGTRPSHFVGDDARPVERVSWHDAHEFLARLSARTPRSRFRLPTEAEWEYACRAGASTAFATGDALSMAQANVGRLVGTRLEGRGQTTPVGSFPPNAWGLHDMHGNVWEWVEDSHCPYSAAGRRDPLGQCVSPLKVIRGGSWAFSAANARCALRYTHRPQDVGYSLGFRVVREPAVDGIRQAPPQPWY